MNDPANIGLLIGIIALVILNSVFSACETVCSAASKVRLRTLEANGNKRASKLLKLLGQYDKMLTTILIGNTVVTVVIASLTTLLFMNLFVNNASLATTLSTVAVTVGVLIFCEITPKIIAQENPEKAGMAFYPFLTVLMFMLWPFAALFSLWKKLIKKIFHIEHDMSITEDELITYVETAASEGSIESHASRLICSAIEFEDVDVEDVMIPRVNVIAVSDTDTLDEIKKKFHEHGFLRMPVYSGTIDSVVGTLHEKDFYEYCIEGKKKVGEVLRPNLIVARTMKISVVLRMLQKARLHMAIVVDEFGGTSGIVTLEDILEELVGEIWDEHDEEEILMRRDGDDTFIISGTENLLDMFEALGIKPAEEFDSTSVGGFVIEILGRIPLTGEKITFSRLDITVTKATARRVLEIKVKLLPEAHEE